MFHDHPRRRRYRCYRGPFILVPITVTDAMINSSTADEGRSTTAISIKRADNLALSDAVASAVEKSLAGLAQ